MFEKKILFEIPDRVMTLTVAGTAPFSIGIPLGGDGEMPSSPRALENPMIFEVQDVKFQSKFRRFS